MNIHKEILDVIIKRKKDKPFIIGINGVDTSGKSTFTSHFSKYLTNIGYKTEIINIDDFHNESKIRYKDKDLIKSYFNNAFNLKRLEEELLIPIKRDGKLSVELTLLNLRTDKYDSVKKYTVDKDTIILIEGVLLYREPINKYFDFRIYLDIPFDEVLKRAKNRDHKIYGDEVVNRYIYKYIPIQKKYIEEFNPKINSNIVIDHLDYFNPRIIK